MAGKVGTALRTYTLAEKTALVTEIERRFQAGEGSIRAIASQLGTCEASYYNWTKAGIKAASQPVKPYSSDERELLQAEVDRLLASGMNTTAACEAVGIAPNTLRRWRQDGDGEPEFRAVGVTALVPSTPGPLVVTAPAQAPAYLSLVAPGGYRIDGLGIETAAALLRALA